MNADEIVRALRNTTDSCNPDERDELSIQAADLIESLRIDNARLQAELTSLRSENAMLRKMQPVVLNGDSARSFALAAELSETKQALVHMTEAYDVQARVHDQLNKDYIAVRDELSALRADIEAENKPLTIGELYSMRKKPVWLVYPIGEAARWTLLAIVLDESMIYDSTHFVFEGTKRRYVLDVEDYGKKWLPYRTEQAKEETHGTSDK